MGCNITKLEIRFQVRKFDLLIYKFIFIFDKIQIKLLLSNNF